MLTEDVSFPEGDVERALENEQEAEEDDDSPDDPLHKRRSFASVISPLEFLKQTVGFRDKG
jgi:hypothetical protein